MGARIAGTRIVGTSLVVLFWLSASGGRADDALVSRVGPIRQSVARRNDLRAPVLMGPLPLGTRPLNHAKEGLIAGAVVGGVMGGWYFGVMSGWGCAEMHPHESCSEVIWWTAAGAAGGALVGGAVGGLIGSQFQTAPSTRAEPLRDRTTLIVLPSRRGIGAALVHSF